MVPFLRIGIAESVGTFALVFAGTSAIVVNGMSGGALGHLGVSLTFGLIVMAMIYALGPVSGAHINPAVTIGFWAAGRLEAVRVPAYLTGQLAGALLASLSVRLLFPGDPTLGMTIPSGAVAQSFVLEVLLTVLLMFVILCVAIGAREQGIMAGAAIGATVGLEALFAGPISGASMNPARSIAPAVVAGDLSALWVYISAPLAGALLAVLLHRVVYPSKAPVLSA